MLDRTLASYPAWMLRPATRPASTHYEIQDAGGALIGATLFSCPIEAKTVAIAIRAAIPATGPLAICEVTEVLIPQRTVRALATID